MERYAAGLALFAVIGIYGCDNSTETDTGDTGAECLNTVKFYPTADASGVYYRTTVEAEFDDVETAATLAVAEKTSGTAVQGTSAWAEKTLVFTPAAPLTPNTQYTATITYSCGNPSVNWTTGDVGDECPSADLVGRSYNLDLTSGRFIEPPGIGAILQSFIGDQIILLGVDSAPGTDIQIIGAMGVPASDPPVQEPCEPTIPFPVADFSQNPYFEIGPETTDLNVQGYTITIQDLYVAGAFAPDGTYIAGAELAGVVDTRPLVPLVDPKGSPDAICKLAQGTVGVTCEACPTDGKPFCLTLVVDSINAVEVKGMSLTAIDNPCLLKECMTDPDCVDSGT